MFTYIILFLPYKIAFIENQNLLITILDYLIDILFVMDIFISVFTA